jgi:uncharacterized protein YkuJ
MSLITRLKDLRSDESKIPRIKKFQKRTEPVYRKAVKVTGEVAKKADRVVKYATKPIKVKHNRSLPWRL